MDDAAAGDPAPDVHQQHVCFLFQKVLLRGLDDGPGARRHPAVHHEKRRQRRREHAVSYFFLFIYFSSTVGITNVRGVACPLARC